MAAKAGGLLRSTVRTITLGALLLLTVAGWIGARSASPPLSSFFDNLHWTASCLAAALMAAWGWTRKDDPQDRDARRWLFIALALLTFGQIGWDIEAAIDWLPFPAPSDPVFLEVGPAFCVAFWKLGQSRLDQHQGWTVLPDALTLLVGGIAATLALILPRQGHTGALQTAVMVSYVVSFLSATCLGFSLLLALRAAPLWSTMLVPLGTLGFTLAWVGWNLRFLAGTVKDGDWLNIGFSVVALLIGAAFHDFRVTTLPDERWDRRCEGIQRVLPLVMVLVAALGILLAAMVPGVPRAAQYSVVIGSVIVAILAAVRQSLLLRERDHLRAVERLLREREAELESKVIERTHQLTVGKETADAANRAKSVFLANMSREIRTPLNSVIGMTQLALELAKEPALRHYLEMTQAAGQHLLSLISDILDMSKIERGKLKIEHAEFQFSEVLSRVAAQMSIEALQKGLSLGMWSDPKLDRSMVGDSLRFEQVLVNFVGNAVKFTEQGSVSISAQVIDDSMPDSWVVRIEVHDTGPGVTPEATETLFEAFQQGDSSTTRRHGGTGLGLAICKELVTLMGGTVGVESESGRGSTFWFSVRLGLGAASGAQRDPEPQQLNISGSRILLVEDNEANQIVAAAMLRRVGAKVVVASNGIEAIDYLHDHGVDCVLMDVQMSGMDGLEATRRIRADPRLSGTTVIAMTANAWDEDRQACLAAGMDDFITKPIDWRSLHETLARWLRPVVSQHSEQRPQET